MIEKNIEFDTDYIRAMTTNFIENYKSRIDNKSIAEMCNSTDVIEAYARGIYDGCLLLLNELNKNNGEVAECQKKPTTN